MSAARSSKKLGTTTTSFDTEVKVLPVTNRESIEKLTGDDPWIRWSGVFGLYRMQKQSIIRDIEHLLDQPVPGGNGSREDLPAEGREIYSAVDLDPSQENILLRLKEEDRLIVQGPPGTGKSQSLTALVTDNLYHGRSCLVVSEKKTALDIIDRNLSDVGLAKYCVVIDDVYRDRKKIVDRVRYLLERRGEPSPAFRAYEYAELDEKHKSLKKTVNHHLSVLNLTCFGDDSAIGLIAKLHKLETENEFRAVSGMDSTLFKLNYEEYKSIESGLGQSHRLFPSAEAALCFDTIRDGHFEEVILTGKTLEENTRSILTLIEKMREIFDRQSAVYGSLFNRLTRINKYRIAALALFLPRYKSLQKDRASLISHYSNILSIWSQLDLFRYAFPDTGEAGSMQDLLQAVASIEATVKRMHALTDEFDRYAAWRAYIIRTGAPGSLILSALARQVPVELWETSFKVWYLKSFIGAYLQNHGIQEGLEQQLSSLADLDGSLMKEIPDKIIHTWDAIQKSFFQRQTISTVKQVYNYRRNKHYDRRNSLRKMIHCDPALFSTAFPVLLVNPVVCSSILPLVEDLYDCVLFDEASQLRIEDVFPALYRGKKTIISGDKHQMPPSSYFMPDQIPLLESSEDALEDTVIEISDDFLAESGSLLEYGMDSDYTAEYLDFHYRSQYPGLIAFSNAAFYGNRLVPMPAIAGDNPFQFHQVAGIYRKDRDKPHRGQ